MTAVRILGAVLMSVAGGFAALSALPASGLADAERARERAAQLDRAARAATGRENRAMLQAAALAGRVQQAEASLRETARRQEAISAERQRIEAGLARQRAPTIKLVSALGTLSRRPPAMMLLQPGSLVDLAHLRAVTAAVGPQVEARTARLRTALARSEALQAQARVTARRQATLQAELTRERAVLLSAAAAERLAASRAVGAADREAERAFAIAEQARSLDTLSRRLQQPGPRGPRTPLPPGDAPEFLPPVVTRSATPGRGGFTGTTLRGTPGALAIAPQGGRVLFAGPYRGFGAIVIIDHGAGWTSLVTGLGRSEVRTGQRVAAGSPLGQSASGLIGWELRRNGQPVDTTPFAMR